jgi:uncharacterized protein
MIKRDDYIFSINSTFEIFSVCALLGPRQCGKTTMARAYLQQKGGESYFFDLEDPTHYDQLTNPQLTLENLKGLIIIDEIQRRPEIFPYLRVLSDYSDKKFLLLGSASGTLLRQSSESLAGRIDYVELTPFTLKETKDFEQLWLLGGFPKSFLAPNYGASLKWRKAYITSFIERDLPALGLNLNATTMRSLWMMLAHCHGQLLNFSNIGRTLGISDMTTRRYMEILSETFMIRLLQPWHENISKRQVKTPKIYIRDSGLLHGLLNVQEQDWYTYPHKGASFEGFAIEEIIRTLGPDAEYYFWRTQLGAELDLLVLKDGKRYGFEIKYADAPQLTKSMHTALHDLKLDHLYIVTPSDQKYPKAGNITVLGIKALPNWVLP